MPAVVVEAQLVGSDMTADNASLKITSAGVSGVMWGLTILMIPMVGCDIYKVEEAGADLNVDREFFLGTFLGEHWGRGEVRLTHVPLACSWEPSKQHRQAGRQE